MTGICGLQIDKENSVVFATVKRIFKIVIKSEQGTYLNNYLMFC